MCQFMIVQVFLAVLARDYEWECNADEKWIAAENQRCADLPVAFTCRMTGLLC